MARTGSRGSRMLAFSAIMALCGLVGLCGNLFLAPPPVAHPAGALRSQASSRLAGSPEAAEVAAEPRVVMEFFGGESTPPPPKREKPFKLPPFFTTLVSLSVVIGGCAYFVQQGSA